MRTQPSNPTATLQRDDQDIRHLRFLQFMFHELKGRVHAALHCADLLVDKSSPDMEAQQLALRLRGILRRTRAIAILENLSAWFIEGRIPQISLSVSIEQLLKIVSECADDIESLHHAAGRNIKIRIETDSFRHAAVRHFPADAVLLEQAIFNILENALKYSYRDTSIKVRADVKEENLLITISNKGIPVQPSDLRFLRKRGWRGPQAKAVTDEGEGLGLWISDEIAKAHYGQVKIIPTNQSGITEVILSISTKK